MRHRVHTQACMQNPGTWDLCHTLLEDDAVRKCALKLLHCAPCPINVNGHREEVLGVGPQEDAAHAEAVLPPRQEGVRVLLVQDRFLAPSRAAQRI